MSKCSICDARCTHGWATVRRSWRHYNRAWWSTLRACSLPIKKRTKNNDVVTWTMCCSTHNVGDPHSKLSLPVWYFFIPNVLPQFIFLLIIIPNVHKWHSHKFTHFYSKWTFPKYPSNSISLIFYSMCTFPHMYFS